MKNVSGLLGILILSVIGTTNALADGAACSGLPTHGQLKLRLIELL